MDGHPICGKMDTQKQLNVPLYPQTLPCEPNETPKPWWSGTFGSVSVLIFPAMWTVVIGVVIHLTWRKAKNLQVIA